MVGSGSVQLMTDPGCSGSTTLPVTICDTWYRHLYLFVIVDIIQWGGQKIPGLSKTSCNAFRFCLHYLHPVHTLPLNRFLCTCGVLPSRDILLTCRRFLVCWKVQAKNNFERLIWQKSLELFSPLLTASEPLLQDRCPVKHMTGHQAWYDHYKLKGIKSDKT
jgi:hypothetical protein